MSPTSKMLNEVLNGLRPEQNKAVGEAVAFLRSKLVDGSRGNEASQLFVSPTGTGKSFMLGAVHRVMTEMYHRRMYTTFTSADIGGQVYGKVYGPVPAGLSATNIQRLLEGVGFWTIKRLHNELMAGRVDIPDGIQHDEAHHSSDNTHEVVHGICGLVPRVGWTATDYRGTPAETTKLRERYPRFYRVLTLKQAIEATPPRMSMPTFKVWPLVNDELIDVTNGEFKVSSVESAIKDKMSDLIDRLRPMWSVEADGQSRIDRPTMIAVPSVGAAREVADAIRAHKDADGHNRMHALSLTGEDSGAVREEVFWMVMERKAILVQIRVVGEGVDLPIRRLIDLSPTMSPVYWMQRVGRICRPIRPDEAAPEYVAACHNLARHAYLFHGVMPVTAVRDAMKAWGEDFKPSRRFLARAVDIEGLGRFEPAAVPFADDVIGTMYAMQTQDGLSEYAIVLHPLRPEPYFFQKTNVLTGRTVTKTIETKSGRNIQVETKEKDFGKWKRVEVLPNVVGCHSIKSGRLSPAQADWWKSSAAKWGLKTDAKVDGKLFQILPIIANTRTKLGVE